MDMMTLPNKFGIITFEKLARVEKNNLISLQIPVYVVIKNRRYKNSYTVSSDASIQPSVKENR